MLTILVLAVRLLNSLAGWAAKRQLMDAGAAIEFRRAMGSADDALETARAARASVDHGADSLRDDPDNRDNRRD
ncbi:hypothetical protein LCM08_06085 [Salipiger pacificus]|nr:hypothetical protein [Alloyangia pacifica]